MDEWMDGFPGVQDPVTCLIPRSLPEVGKNSAARGNHPMCRVALSAAKTSWDGTLFGLRQLALIFIHKSFN